MNTIALNEHIKQLRARDPMVAVTLNPEKSAIAMLRGQLADPVNVEELSRAPYDFARQFIRENRVLLGDLDERTTLDNQRVMTDRQGMTHVSFAQKYGNALVWGGNLAVHYAADGSVYLVNSNLAAEIDVPTSPRIESSRAVDIAKDHAGSGASLFDGMLPSLVVVDAETVHREGEGQKYYLCWKLGIILSTGEETDWVYFVDALEGRVLLRYSAMRTGTGTGHYSQGEDLNSEKVSDTSYRLRDTVTSSTWPEATKPIIHIYDDNGSTSRTLTDYSEDDDDDWDDTGTTNRRDDQRPEVDLHRFGGYVLDYYYSTHGYNGWNGAGSDIEAHAHNERHSNNAFWNDFYQQIYFADGDGTDRDFMCPLDTVAHEYTHGVKFYFNILQTYEGETGALDEATSDLFGAFIAIQHPADEPWPWHHGRQYRLDGTVGRNMIDPSRDTAGVVQYDTTSEATKLASSRNGFYPDHYSIRYNPPLPWDGSVDNDRGGVHVNCPIITHAVYLMINGGTHRLSGVTVTGIGVGPIEEMLYRVISTGLLTNTSNFADFRLAFITACKDLYPANPDYLLTVKTAFYAVGIGPDLGMRFIVERSTLGEDEINARRGDPPESAVVSDAFRVVVDGFSAAEIGITGSDATLDVDVFPPTDGMTINPMGNTSDTGGYGPEEQRFTFHYDLDFGLTNDAFEFEEETKLLTLNVEIPSISLSASAQIQLIKQPNPFILHGETPWLSIDLRLFVVRAGEDRFGVDGVSDANDAPRFIQEVMKALTDGKGVAGGESFDADLETTQAASSLYLQPEDESGNPVFNFALAKVHYIGSIDADNVRVFFRLLSTQSTNTAYDIPPGSDHPMTGNYRFWSDGTFGRQKIALAGIQGDEYVTIPCFALLRVDTATTSMIDQTDSRTDDSGNVLGNVQNITANPDGSEVDTFFGCWLDTNQPSNKVLPIEVTAGNEDGPFTDADDLLSIQEAIIRNGHQCLIAEIAFDPVEIPVGKNPSNWDKLAQRNIAWNSVGSARAVSTFEIRPTPAMASESGQMPDELMIDWGNTPRGYLATIYLPGVNIADVLVMADRMYTTHRLEQVDAHTLQCPTGGITYVPIPSGTDVNYVGLLSVDLPERLDPSQVFNIVVRQVTNDFGELPPVVMSPMMTTSSPAAAVAPTDIIAWRRVLGAFQLTIPVQSKEILLPREERLLSVFRWIQAAIPADNRWYSVFNRYVGQIADRVDAFGGDSSQVVASPSGEWQKVRRCRTFAVINAVLLAVFIVALGILSNWVGVAVLAIFLAATAITWLIQCQPKFCSLVRIFVAGAGVGTLILSILALFGVSSPQLITVLVAAAILTAIAGGIGIVRKCF